MFKFQRRKEKNEESKERNENLACTYKADETSVKYFAISELLVIVTSVERSCEIFRDRTRHDLFNSR